MPEKYAVSGTKRNESPGGSSTGMPYVAGLGASAGGLEALQQFFSNTPADSGMAFVVIQHLYPDYKSMMVELLSKTTGMKVNRVENGMLVEPNQVYIIPPKTQMTIFHGKLLLTAVDHGMGLLLPIDAFLKSLADDQGERSIGVVLSGTGSDGTRGIRAIKEAGGMVMVQQENTAKFGGMPGSAIATGLADFILPPGQMPDALQKYIQHPYLKSSPAEKQVLLTADNQLDKLISIIRDQTRVDFSLYKPSTILRRIERRMGIAQVVSIDDYIRYLSQSKAETKVLFKDLLISVTRFFRDAEAYRALREKVIPGLFEKTGPENTARIWVAGCATGEEAYSIAILCADYLEETGQKKQVKIFATDIDREVLEYAARGIYPDSIAADLPDPKLRRFFTKEGASYNVNPAIRQMVVFASHNILSDPPFNRMDMVTCRNLLIYLKPALQQRVLRVFSFALYPRGYLFLGSSESIGEMTDVFDTLSVRHKLFHHRGSVKPVLAEGIDLQPFQERLFQRNTDIHQPARPNRTGEIDRTIDQIADKIIND